MPYVARDIDNNENLPIRVNSNGEVYVLIELLKWERFDVVLESGGYTYMGFRSLTDSTYRVKRIKDDDMAVAYCYGDGTLPASASWTGLVYE
jgi:hypothetical protein